GIEIKRHARGRRHLHRAAELLSAAENHLRSSRLEFGRITAAGDFRRGCELVSELALVAETIRRDSPVEMLQFGHQLRIYLTDKARYGITLLLATGSQAHLAQLRAVANQKKFVLDADGLRQNG